MATPRRLTNTCALGHEHADAWERIYCDVTEDYCFLCSRATDHRGEHEPADLQED